MYPAYTQDASRINPRFSQCLPGPGVCPGGAAAPAPFPTNIFHYPLNFLSFKEQLMIPNHIIKSQISKQIDFPWNLFVCLKFYAFFTSIIFQKIIVIQYLCIPLFQHLFLGHALLIRLSGSLSVLLSSFSYTVDIMLIPPPLGHIFPIKNRRRTSVLPGYLVFVG